MKKISQFLNYSLAKIDGYQTYNDLTVYSTPQGLPVACVYKINDGQYQIYIMKKTADIVDDFSKNRSKYSDEFSVLLRSYGRIDQIPLDSFKRSLLGKLKFLSRYPRIKDVELYSKSEKIVDRHGLFDILVGDLKLTPSLFEKNYGEISDKSTGRIQNVSYKKWDIHYDTNAKSSIDNVKLLLDEAESKLLLNNLSHVAYGKIYVVNTLAGATLADYDLNNDIVRISYKKTKTINHNIIDSFLHELGHRNFYKNLTPKQKSEIQMTFLNKQNNKKSVEIGDIVFDKESGNRFKILKHQYKRSLVYIAELIEIKKESKKFKLHTEYVLPSELIGTVLLPESKDSENSSYFPSVYSLKNYEEFYAELFSHWMNKTLKEPTKTWFINLHKGV